MAATVIHTIGPAAAVVITGLGLAACAVSTAGGPAPLSVADAVDQVDPGTEVEVRAVLVTEDGVPYLCDYVLESQPQQCADPSVELRGAPLDELDLEAADGERAGEVTLRVVLDGGIAEYVATR